MSQTTFPAFTNMLPEVEDIQLIVDSLRTEDKNRITRDGIFTPGIVNEPSDYLSSGTSKNSLKIKPFIAYTLNGNRVEVESTWDNLYATGSIITVTEENALNNYKNIPVWYQYKKNYSNLDSNSIEQTLDLATLGKGSILHGIKLRVNELFGVTNSTTQPNIFVSIGTTAEPEKFLPPTLVSSDNSSSNLSVMNLMYSLDDANETQIKITFTSDTVTLNKLTNGSLTINLCVANLTGFDNSALEATEGGYQLSNDAVGTWQPSTTYHIVVRYTEVDSKPVSLTYTDENGTTITTDSEPTRKITSYQFFALRKTGSTIDYTTSDDIKIGEIQTDVNGDIYAININGIDPRSGNKYTQYLTIPGYRYTNNIDASQIADGSVNNTKFQFLNTLTSNVQNQLNSKANLNTDNTFTGKNTFTSQIDGDVKTVNGFTAFATPTKNSLLVLDNNAKIPAEAISESTVASIGNFYTVSSGILKDGRSAFLEKNSSSDGVIIKASSTNPLVLNYPDGTVEKLYSDVTVSSLSADGFYYLVKEQNGEFQLLPTAGGTKACIPVVNTGNKFTYEELEGNVKSSFENSTAFNAFNGNTINYTQMGSVYYKNYNGDEQEGYLPQDTPTYIEITFPKPVAATSFSACFRQQQNECTPKTWLFEAKNESDADWTPLLQQLESTTWNIGEIKQVRLSNTSAFTTYRFTFNVSKETINNYMFGEQTAPSGITMPINCYYFQIYANNTDTTNKGSIIEGYTYPTNVSVGSYFLDISKKPYKGYKSTGSVGENAWTPVNFVKLGFVELIGYNTDNQQLNVYPFSYNTFTLSNGDSVIKNTPITFNHNLGIIPNIVDMKFICIKENNGYKVGETINNMYTLIPNIGLKSLKEAIDMSVTSLKIYPSTDGNQLMIMSKTGKIVSTTSEQWKVVIYCSRGW